MSLQTVVESIGVFGIGSGLLAWLIRSLFKQALDRDIEAFKHGLRRTHEIEMEESKNRFTVGATSHMADVAFDKHVEFCEEYTAEVFVTLEALFRHGPYVGALDNASRLYGVRKKWAVWLTPDIDKVLEQFETKVRTIGADAHLLAVQPGEPEAIKRMFSEFAAILGAKHGFANWEGRPVPQEHAIEAVITELRRVLGIYELTSLRSTLVARAIVNELGSEANKA